MKTAVIGLGRLGTIHVNNLLNIRNIEVVAVCDSSIERSEKVAKQYQIPFYTDNINAILENEQIEAVVIVTSTSSHYEIITKAIDANKAIFVEKPLTIELETSKKILAHANEKNAFVQVGFMRRFDPDYAAAKKCIEEGQIGKPLYFKAISRDPDAPPNSFLARSGGIFIDFSIHDYDLARFLMNDDIISVASFGRNIKYPDLATIGDIDTGISYIEFAKGGCGDVESSRCALYGYDIRTEIVGSEGTIRIGSSKKNNVQLLNSKGNSSQIIPIFYERFEEAYKNEFDAFVQAVQNNEPSPVSIEDSIHALQVAHLAQQSFELGKKVSIGEGSVNV
ncbi:oxidoreductase [Ureibacillus massiliensis 4400831 = CIP 108448 = CCUG 49529]|uniref:Oxidoreductase n=1 Tax=Ureibacillus massiliensis 4400831 = CIP 108448 = CCUG 49529 TaxID=1211035 RepID=A0A0A3J0Y2_9BACL|nr:Gfo/Idh/MocA family oxidoreductase [Ureibacillus massiliensis]KGR89350.1 oxidoreductase [Ureibacillus massiliensis 4400831 = CIP 108448 = CCUG 49529]